MERLRALAQEAVDEGGLPGPVRAGEEDEGGEGTRLAREMGVSPILQILTLDKPPEHRLRLKDLTVFTECSMLREL